jgi:hypothetical protein
LEAAVIVEQSLSASALAVESLESLISLLVDVSLAVLSVYNDFHSASVVAAASC